MSGETCTRCGADVAPILDGPPDRRDVWHRFQIKMERRQVSNRMVWRRFTRRWLPENPADQVTEIHTYLDLCDDCAGAVFLFAQGKAQP